MNLNSLRIFVALARLGSFTQTATELRTVQPAISRHIRSLEEELGYKLFERSSRKVQLTSRGVEFLEAVGLSVERIYSALKEPSNNAVSVSFKGTVSIASLHDAGIEYLWPRLMGIKEHFPHLDFNTSLVSTQEVLSLLASDDVSLALTSQLSSRKSLVVKPIRSDELVLVQGSRTLGFQQSKLRFVTYRKSDRATMQFLRRNLSRAKLKDSEFCGAINSHRAILEFIERFPYVAVVPRIAAAADIDSGRILVGVKDKMVQVLNLVTLARHLERPEVQLVWDRLSQ